jgi:hypothetical protein
MYGRANLDLLEARLKRSGVARKVSQNQTLTPIHIQELAALFDPPS